VSAILAPASNSVAYRHAARMIISLSFDISVNTISDCKNRTVSTRRLSGEGVWQ